MWQRKGFSSRTLNRCWFRCLFLQLVSGRLSPVFSLNPAQGCRLLRSQSPCRQSQKVPSSLFSLKCLFRARNIPQSRSRSCLPIGTIQPNLEPAANEPHPTLQPAWSTLWPRGWPLIAGVDCQFGLALMMQDIYQGRRQPWTAALLNFYRSWGSFKGFFQQPDFESGGAGSFPLNSQLIYFLKVPALSHYYPNSNPSRDYPTEQPSIKNTSFSKISSFFVWLSEKFKIGIKK